MYSSVWSKEVLLVHGHLEIIHGRATWTIKVDELHCSGVPMCCPFFGRLFVQTALLALDESLDEQEMGLSSYFPISCPFVQGVVQDIVVILERVFLFVSHVSRSRWWAGYVDPFSQKTCYVSSFEWPTSLQ